MMESNIQITKHRYKYIKQKQNQRYDQQKKNETKEEVFTSTDVSSYQQIIDDQNYDQQKKNETKEEVFTSTDVLSYQQIIDDQNYDQKTASDIKKAVFNLFNSLPDSAEKLASPENMPKLDKIEEMYRTFGTIGTNLTDNNSINQAKKKGEETTTFKVIHNIRGNIGGVLAFQAFLKNSELAQAVQHDIYGLIKKILLATSQKPTFNDISGIIKGTISSELGKLIIPDTIKIILVDILNNAYLHGGDANPTIQVLSSDGNIILSIHNTVASNKEPIDLEQIEKILKGEKTSANKNSNSTGTTNMIKTIQDMGGTISITSSQEEGTTFTLTIPQDAFDSQS